jgi:hypothetical protein
VRAVVCRAWITAGVVKARHRHGPGGRLSGPSVRSPGAGSSLPAFTGHKRSSEVWRGQGPRPGPLTTSSCGPWIATAAPVLSRHGIDARTKWTLDYPWSSQASVWPGPSSDARVSCKARTRAPAAIAGSTPGARRSLAGAVELVLRPGPGAYEW